jgi:mono/diheme cytochrome c family protein
LPPATIDALKAGLVNLDDPAVTVQLLKLNAVVGVIGKVTGPGNHLATIGITCALCHSIVDDSVAPGIGKRLDGWANRSLDVGAIIALSPVLPDQPYKDWGPGRYDARFTAFDGDGFIQLNPTSLPVLIPSIFGLEGVGFETYTGDGPISYWNNYVGVTQMGGQGNFKDLRSPINLDIVQTPDLVTPKLPALLQYQLSLRAPAPPQKSFSRPAATRGEELFNGVARCATCHTPPLYTDVTKDPAPFLHAPSEDVAEQTYATRSATGMYRTTPLRALWQHPPYFHDGSAANLRAVVDHYVDALLLVLTEDQKTDLVEFLKSL